MRSNTLQTLEKREYGRLTIDGEPFRDNGVTYVYANCICGSKERKRYALWTLKCSNTKSCGCLHKEKVGDSHRTHGLRKHPIYRVYAGMKRRCYNHNESNYYRYGGRGIKICNEWISNYQTFHNWAIANGYKKGLTIERINNDGNYEPSNCTFATMAQQSMNRSTTKLTPLRIKHIKILYEKSKKTQTELSYLYGVSQTHIWRIVNNKLVSN